MSEDGKDAGAGGKRGGATKLLIFGLVGGLLLGGGAAAAYFLFLNKPATDGAATESAGAKPVADSIYVKLDRLSAPVLSGDQVVGYILFDLALEVRKTSDELMVVKRLPAIRAAFLRAVTDNPIGKPDQPFVVDFDGLTNRLKETANRELGQPLVTRVLVVQTTRI